MIHLKKIVAGVSTFVLLVPSILLAETHAFVPLQEIPNFTDKTDPASFFSAIFTLGITIATFLAVIMIMIGGLQYMSTDKISGKEDGKEKITQAILGIILILLSVIILEIINPNILDFNLFN